MNLFEIAYLSDNDVKKFKSDFRIVADYFVQMRKNVSYTPSAETIIHVREMMELLSALAVDNRFKTMLNEVEIQKGEHMNMAGLFDKCINNGRIMALAEMMKNGGTEADLKKFHNATDEDIRKAKEFLKNPSAKYTIYA